MFTKHWYFITMLSLCAFACSSKPYYGYSAEEWALMSTAQQEKAKADFARLVKSKNAMAYDQSIEEDSYDFLKKGLE